MFKKDTVIVVRAGASFEARFPLGVDLKRKIAGVCSQVVSESVAHYSSKWSDEEFYNELFHSKHFFNNTGKLQTALQSIASGVGYAPSVDGFLEIHSLDEDVQICAKAAIVKLILGAEEDSLLFVPSNRRFNSLDTSKLQDTWFLELAHIMFEGVSRENLKEAFDAVTFIAFNYDRCIEWFLFHALQGLYVLTPFGCEIASR
jgi:hypothetical protein